MRISKLTKTLLTKMGVRKKTEYSPFQINLMGQKLGISSLANSSKKNQELIQTGRQQFQRLQKLGLKMPIVAL